MRKLPHRGYFQSFRICPNCGGKFTVDRDTKIRQVLFIVIVLISLGFTILLYFQGSRWIGVAELRGCGVVDPKGKQPGKPCSIR